MKNPNVNWSGYLTFAASFAFATVFIVYIIYIQPGPVDEMNKYKDLAVGLTHDENIQRKEAWFQSNPAAVERGASLYSTNCAYCHSTGATASLSDKMKSNSLQHGAKEVELFKTITRGMQGQHRFEYLMENDRWALVHYLRSLNSGLPSSSKSDFKKYLKEGI